MSLSKKLVLGFVSLFSFFFASRAEALAGASFSLSPSAGTCSLGGTFDLDIVLQSDDLVSGATAIVNYDPVSLEATAITNGGIFPEALIDDIDSEPGTARFDALVDFKVPEDFTGSGTFATISFRVLDVGETSLSFDFVEGSTSDSNVAHTDTHQDILTSTSGGTYTFEENSTDATLGADCSSDDGGGDFTTPTPTPTESASGGPTPTPTTSAGSDSSGGSASEGGSSGSGAPGGGSLEPTIFISLVSVLMVGLGLVLR